jgi:hypothetical protein
VKAEKSAVAADALRDVLAVPLYMAVIFVLMDREGSNAVTGAQAVLYPLIRILKIALVARPEAASLNRNNSLKCLRPN